jgi:virginiamycin B lyase
VVVPGPVKAIITEWDMPTPFSMPHDSIYSPRTGLTWVTEQFGNALAQFDPETRKIKEYHLPRLSGPHMLLEDEEGNIFFDSHSEGIIGKFDPKTGTVEKYYTIPGPKLILHDIALDKKGFVWFAVMEARPPLYPVGSKIGRLNTKTGEVKFADIPTPNAAPYGLALTSKGVPFFTEDDAPRLGSVDPDTMKVTEYYLPNPKSGTRRLSITPDDIIWYTDNLRGYLGRFDPKTGKFSEWPSPSGPRSFPYGIAVSGNAVWYAESHSKPNMLVRFDMQTEKFQSWPVNAGGGIKHVYAQPDGNLWLTRSLTNGIAYVKVFHDQ